MTPKFQFIVIKLKERFVNVRRKDEIVSLYKSKTVALKETQTPAFSPAKTQSNSVLYPTNESHNLQLIIITRIQFTF